jgi:hypothetical protein
MLSHDERDDDEGKRSPASPCAAAETTSHLHDSRRANRYGATSVNLTSRLYEPGTSATKSYVVL